MRKVLSIYLVILFSTFSFAFKIDVLEFGKIIDFNQKADKIFTLTNNDIETKIYRLSIEGDKNAKVKPSLINLQPQQSKEFKVEIIAKDSKGNHNYFLVINEVKKDKLKKGVSINKIIRIKQEYLIK